MGGCCSCKGWYGTADMNRNVVEEEEEVEEEFYEDADIGDGARVRLEGSCGFAAMHTQQGRKGVNQDAMTLWEDFAGEKDTIFCGVFDGHGPLGHRVARHVRDALPAKLSSEYESLQQRGHEDVTAETENPRATYANEDDGDGDHGRDTHGDTHPWVFPWMTSFVKAFKEMDDELGRRSGIDCICSGTTAVSIVKQKDRLIIANLGDSRALLCTRDGANRPVPVQLTVDLKPNLPEEERRIRSCQGRVFALEDEPDVHRLWLPDENCPGLAMARALGDFCLKEYGLISTPQVTYRKLTEKDEFVVLATDGVWDVLSNMDVVKIVSSTAKRSHAAKQLVDRAVRAWEEQHPTSKSDDCAAICLFLNPAPSPNGVRKKAHANGRKKSRELSLIESFKTARSGVASESFHSTNAGDEGGEEWTAIEGVTRSNSLTTFPRFTSLLSWRREQERAQQDEKLMAREEPRKA